MNKKVEDTLSKLESALKRLGEALAADSSNALFVDGNIREHQKLLS